MVNYLTFPNLQEADEDGLLAMGGDLSVDTLVSAYAQGIFPWFNDDQPILWWSPDPRLVLFPDRVKVSKSLAKKIRQARHTVTCNQAFEQVISGCALRGSQHSTQQSNNQSSNQASASSAGEEATWITEGMHQAYLQLHRAGYAHSIEVWQQKTLVGGLYGVLLGKVFFGESMFSRAPDASKLALVALCRHMQRSGRALIDCQVASQHLFSMGAEEIARDEFMQHLRHINLEHINLEHINLQQQPGDFAQSFNEQA